MVRSDGRRRGSVYHHAYVKARNIFEKHDADNSGCLDLSELSTCLSEVMGTVISVDATKIACDEFDKDASDTIDIAEFSLMVKYLEDEKEKNLDLDAHTQLQNAISQARLDQIGLSEDIAGKLYPLRNILCIQDEDGAPSHMLDSPVDNEENPLDEDFVPAFAPCNMRCLALVSHNEMKATMKEFVIANKNILKKFRLTGTNSTMTMLREVFADEPTVVYGPSCSSGPLGGDAELVALMCSGLLGGMLFFQDPMSAHPHQSDIDCLVRQGLVHNTMMANTPTSAIMMMQVFRMALKGRGMPEFMPSFFFTLQSPAVTAYKAAQKKVIASHAT